MMKQLLILLAVCAMGCAGLYATEDSAVLSAVLDLEQDEQGKIFPGSHVKFKAIVKNRGNKPSPAGQIWVSFAFPKQLEKEEKSLLFETEKAPLPTIKPGEEITIEFEKEQHMPTITDFVRYDWPMREYGVYININDKTWMIGKRSLTFSGYYYGSPPRQIPGNIPAM